MDHRHALFGVSLAAAFWDCAVCAVAGASVCALVLVRLDQRFLKSSDQPDPEPSGRVSRGTTTESVVASGDFVGVRVGQTFVVSGPDESLVCQAERMQVGGVSRLAGSMMDARIIGRLDNGRVEFGVARIGLPEGGTPVELAPSGGESTKPTGTLVWKCGRLAGSGVLGLSRPRRCDYA